MRNCLGFKNSHVDPPQCVEQESVVDQQYFQMDGLQITLQDIQSCQAVDELLLDPSDMRPQMSNFKRFCIMLPF